MQYDEVAALVFGAIIYHCYVPTKLALKAWFQNKVEPSLLSRYAGAQMSTADMYKPRPAALFGAARLVLFMILKWYFR